MSFYSYTECECTFPDTTKTATEIEDIFNSRDVTHEDGTYKIQLSGETSYSDHILDEFVELFGKPLDKVEGLDLYVHYSTDEEGHYECELTIHDGECGFKESEIVMVERPLKECPIAIDGKRSPWERRYDECRAKEAWKQLEDCCTDDDDNIDTDWEVPALYRTYPKGTNREEIWHDIEDRFHVSVAWLMGFAKNSDGSNE